MKTCHLFVFGMIILCVRGGRKFRTIGLNASPPTFVHPQRNVTVTEDQEVTLKCSVNNVHGYQIAWVHEETQNILSIGRTLYTQMPRLSLTADHKSAALTISPVRAQDRGWYMCQVNTDPMTYTRSYLQVLVPPVLTDWSGSSVEAREGAAVSLICSARAYPPANTTWRRTDAEPIFEKPRIVWVIEGPDLVFPSVRREHHAAYTCHVTNGVTTPVSRTTYLTVTYAPLIWLERDMVGTKAGVDTTLNCTSEGNPTPKHYWSVNSSNITESSKYHMEEVKNGTRTKFILTVRNPGPGDFTYYGCHAVNPTGHAKGTINLFEIREQVISVPTQPTWHTTTPEIFFEPQEIPKSPQMPSASSPINHSSNKIRVDTQRRKNVVTNRLPPSPSDDYKLGGKGQIYPPRIAETPVGRNRTSFKELFNFIPLSNRSCEEPVLAVLLFTDFTLLNNI